MRISISQFDDDNEYESFPQPYIQTGAVDLQPTLPKMSAT